MYIYIYMYIPLLPGDMYLELVPGAPWSEDVLVCSGVAFCVCVLCLWVCLYECMPACLLVWLGLVGIVCVVWLCV